MFALITGASRGIGKACAEEFAKHGVNLVLVCKNNIELLNETSRELRNYGITCHTMATDVSDVKQVEKLFEALELLNIHIDILINNAGISHVGLLQEMEYEEWHQVIDTNLSSVFYMCKNIIPAMIKKGSGRIINISSVWGEVGASMEVAYSASKGALISFSKALAKELAPSNIQVNALSFGAIDTEMNNHLSADEKRELISEIPSCRMGTALEAAKLVYDIATTSSYLTGANVRMDGAWI